MSEGEDVDVWNLVVDWTILLSPWILVSALIFLVFKLFLLLNGNLTILGSVPLIFSTKHTEQTTSLLKPSSSAPSASSAIVTTSLRVSSSVKALLRTFVSLILLLVVLTLLNVENTLSSMLIGTFELLSPPSVSALIILSHTKVVFCPAELFNLCEQFLNCPWSFPSKVLSTWANFEAVDSCINYHLIWDTHCLSLDVQEPPKVLGE